MNDHHRRAEELSAQAAVEARSGRRQESWRLYSTAADVEAVALEDIPRESERTRSILSVSVASLLYKARRYDEAELAIFRFLGSGSLTEWASGELRELLEVVADERLLLAQYGRRYSGSALTVSLRGGEIGSGTGPLDLILSKATGFKSIIYRVAEWIGEYPLRVRGSPPPELQHFIQARATEPAYGSYRMEVRLTEPEQQDLFEEVRVQPAEVSDTVFRLFESLTRGTREDVESLVPDRRYRKALLDLCRNVVPGGKRVKEMGLYRSGADGVESIYLTSDVGARVRDFTPKPSAEPGRERQTLQGTLRALHLDRNWLEVTIESGKHIRCDTLPDMLDDVVGPMVNNEVRVSGQMRTHRRSERLLVDEIELVEE